MVRPHNLTISNPLTIYLWRLRSPLFRLIRSPWPIGKNASIRPSQADRCYGIPLTWICRTVSRSDGRAGGRRKVWLELQWRGSTSWHMEGHDVQWNLRWVLMDYTILWRVTFAGCDIMLNMCCCCRFPSNWWTSRIRVVTWRSASRPRQCRSSPNCRCFHCMKLFSSF